MNILHENCDPELASDPSLPYSAYLIEYIDQGETKWDIAVAPKQSELFDYYWDKYKAVTNMTQSQGRVSPKLWKNPKAKPAKKK
tara:strand:- start:1192 stop:1443 length:252 start_codon:yes stop_codon:yes gene_type:complete